MARLGNPSGFFGVKRLIVVFFSAQSNLFLSENCQNDKKKMRNCIPLAKNVVYFRTLAVGVGLRFLPRQTIFHLKHRV